MRPAMPKICTLCGREVFGNLGMSVHRRRMHGPHKKTADLYAPPPKPKKKHLVAYRAKWKAEQANARPIRPDIHERFMAILEKAQ